MGRTGSASPEAELKRADLTYDDLAERLKKHGFKETKASIANKLARATVPASFFLACLAAMELEGVALSESNGVRKRCAAL
jgi:hypothetical protein